MGRPSQLRQRHRQAVPLPHRLRSQ